MRDRYRGLTLLELIMGVAILAIATGLALPSMSSVIAASRYASTSHELTAALALARSSAITRRERVSVCPILQPGRCSDDHDWSAGWMVFRDEHGKGIPDTTDDIIRAHQRSSADGLTVASTPGRRLVRFTPDGSAAGSNLTISICDTHRERLMGQVVVSRTGRTRSRRTEPGTGADCPHSP